MKKTFNKAIVEQLQEGVTTMEAVKIVEDSGEFSEEEIQKWWDSFHEMRNKESNNR